MALFRARRPIHSGTPPVVSVAPAPHPPPAAMICAEAALSLGLGLGSIFYYAGPGIATPVQTPPATPKIVARAEEPRPDPGSMDYNINPMLGLFYQQTKNVLANADAPPQEQGRAVYQTNPLRFFLQAWAIDQIAAERPPPDPGTALSSRIPQLDLKVSGRSLIALVEPAPPDRGQILASPVSPPRPAPSAQGVETLAASEMPRLDFGQAFSAHPPFTPASVPTRGISVIACVDPPRPDSLIGQATFEVGTAAMPPAAVRSFPVVAQSEMVRPDGGQILALHSPAPPASVPTAGEILIANSEALRPDLLVMQILFDVGTPSMPAPAVRSFPTLTQSETPRLDLGQTISAHPPFIPPSVPIAGILVVAKAEPPRLEMLSGQVTEATTVFPASIPAAPVRNLAAFTESSQPAPGQVISAHPPTPSPSLPVGTVAIARDPSFLVQLMDDGAIVVAGIPPGAIILPGDWELIIEAAGIWAIGAEAGDVK